MITYKKEEAAQDDYYDEEEDDQTRKLIDYTLNHSQSVEKPDSEFIQALYEQVL